MVRALPRRLFILAVFIVAVGCHQAESEPTVARLPDVAGPGTAEPNLAAGGDGSIALSWLAQRQDISELRFSKLINGNWTPATTVASGSDWFVNWADFPSVVPIAGSLWAAHWLRRSGEATYAYDVEVALSTDAGRTWSRPLSPHRDGTQTEHGFVSLFPQSGGVGVLWLDGRNMASNDHAAHTNMTLRAAVVSADGTLQSEHLVDERVCDCCQTDVALTGDVPIAVYRDRDDAEVRDIRTASFRDGKWIDNGTVAHDGWEIAGCPVNGPAIDARGDDVVVAWFTAADNQPKVRLAFSQDGGRQFGAPIDVATESALGRVGVALQTDRRAAWVSVLTQSTEGAADIQLIDVDETGRVREPITIARTEDGRSSGFPQLAQAGGDLIVAWTDLNGDVAQVRSARVSVP